MKFIERTKTGEVQSINSVAQYQGQEQLLSDHPDVIAFEAKINNVAQTTISVEIVAALNEFVTNGTRKKLDVLLIKIGGGG